MCCDVLWKGGFWVEVTGAIFGIQWIHNRFNGLNCWHCSSPGPAAFTARLGLEYARNILYGNKHHTERISRISYEKTKSHIFDAFNTVSWFSSAVAIVRSFRCLPNGGACSKYGLPGALQTGPGSKTVIRDFDGRCMKMHFYALVPTSWNQIIKSDVPKVVSDTNAFREFCHFCPLW